MPDPEDGTKLLAWLGTDPDARVNCYQWFVTAGTGEWEIEPDMYHSGWTNQKGPVHVGQYRPRGVKKETKTEDICTEYNGPKQLDFFQEGKKSMAIKTYKDFCRTHMIKSGMWDVFHWEDPLNATIKHDLFLSHSWFPLSHIKSNIDGIKAAADKYALNNLEWSGEYLRNSLKTDLLTQVLEEVEINATGPKVLVDTMTVLFSDSFDAMET